MKIDIPITCPECLSQDNYPIEINELEVGTKGCPTWTNLWCHVLNCTGCRCDFVFHGHYKCEVDGCTRKIVPASMSQVDNGEFDVVGDGRAVPSLTPPPPDGGAS